MPLRALRADVALARADRRVELGRAAARASTQNRRLGLALLGLAATAGIVHIAGAEGVARVLVAAAPWLPFVLVVEGARIAVETLATLALYGVPGRAIPRPVVARAHLIGYAMTAALPAGRTVAEAYKALARADPQHRCAEYASASRHERRRRDRRAATVPVRAQDHRVKRGCCARARTHARSTAMTEFLACTDTHTLPDGRLELLGASRSVTGAMTRVELGRSALLVDCGIAQGREARRWRMPDAARDVDAVLLTHGHNDHIGSLPALLDGGWKGPILGTRATLDVARLSLEDSLRMNDLPRADVKAFLGEFDRLKRAVGYDRDCAPFDGFGGAVAFREAGHILGSSSVEIRYRATRVVISGDLGRPDSPVLRDPNTTWDQASPVDLVVMECTYGSREHSHDHSSIEDTLARVVTEAVAQGGKVFVPAFAIGRTQTLLYFLDRLVTQGRVPQVPVFVDTPMGLAVTDIYNTNRGLYDRESLAKLAAGDDPLDFERLFAVEKGSDSARVRAHKGPAVVIAGSGMCSGGRILKHLVEGLPDPRNTLLFVGHQAEGTLGRRIQRADGGDVRIEGEDVAVRARVETLRGLSAHADRKELVGWLSAIPSPTRVALHHGDEDAQRAFVEWAPAALRAATRG